MVYLIDNLARVTIAVVALATGVLCRRFKLGRPIDYLSKFLLFIVMPYLIVYSTIFTDLSKVSAMIFVSATYTAAAVILCFVSYSKLLRYRREFAGSLIYSSALQNTGFLPIPLVTVLYGIPDPAAIYNAANIMVGSIAVPVVGNLLRREGGNVGLLSVLKGILKFPPAIALLISLILRALLGSTAPPTPLTVAKNFLGTIILSSFAIVGYSILGIGRKALSRPVLWVVAWRLLFSPLIHIALSAAVGLSGVWLATTLIESVMPPATMNLVFARIYGFRDDIIAVTIALITPLSLIASVIIGVAIPAQ